MTALIMGYPLWQLVLIFVGAAVICFVIGITTK